MGDLVHLDERRRRRRAQQARGRTLADAPRVKLYIDLADPQSYLAAERVERALPRIAWRLAYQGALETSEADCEVARRAAEQRAAQLRLPLQWPDRHPAPVVAAMRAATFALEAGRGQAFVLAAGRLAFGGGYDLDEPEVLMEAAAAAGVPVDACLKAAADPRRDASLEAAGRRLRAAGAERVPALRVSGTLLCGEGRISAYLASGSHLAAAFAGDGQL